MNALIWVLLIAFLGALVLVARAEVVHRRQLAIKEARRVEREIDDLWVTLWMERAAERALLHPHDQ